MKVSVKMNHKQSHQKLTLMLRLMEKVYDFLIHDTSATKRELFYQFLLPNQAILDSGVVKISNFLEAAPWEFGILATAKGIAAGDLIIYFSDSEKIDCKNGFVLKSTFYIFDAFCYSIRCAYSCKHPRSS
jgi:DNA topoisomerase VI subunit A